MLMLASKLEKESGFPNYFYKTVLWLCSSYNLKCKYIDLSVQNCVSLIYRCNISRTAV